MTIEEAMYQAVAGGYHLYGSDGMETDYAGANSAFTAWTRTDNASTFQIAVEETFLDPHFWQALGRALGWSEVCDLAMFCVQREKECRRCRGSYWIYQWHHFIQTLAEGNPSEAFFASLPASQRMVSGRQHRHQYASAQQARTKARLARQTAQATREQCQRTWHRRVTLWQGLHGQVVGEGVPRESVV
jgi:hypothetical protein